jgi:hypothetical protein
MLDLLFIFIDPCAGRHLLTFFAAPKKVSKERRFTPLTLSVHLQRDNGVVRKAPCPGNFQNDLNPDRFATSAVKKHPLDNAACS